MDEDIFSYVVTHQGEAERDLGSAGLCIYCRTSEAGLKLTKEHIIPEGIGGNATLSSASCSICQTKINKFEQPVQKRFFGMTRALRGISAKKKRRKTLSTQEFKFFDRAMSHEEVAAIATGKIKSNQGYGAVSQFFTDGIMLEDYQRSPGIFTCERPDFISPMRLVFSCTPTKENRSMSSLITVHTGWFEKFLAKVAHGFASAVLGLDGFRPYLDKFIIDDTFTRKSYLIGSYQVTPSKELHRIVLHVGRGSRIAPPMMIPTSFPIIICDIHLFADLSPIAYQVVVGEPVVSNAA